MQKYFKPDYLRIILQREKPSMDGSVKFHLHFEADYNGSVRKSSLWINEDRFANDVENLWKSIKTKKMLSVKASFDEIDWYDDMTDVYDTPIASMKRGLRKAKIVHQQHGSIPKEWAIQVSFIVDDTNSITPFEEIIKATIGTYYTDEFAKRIKKVFRPVLQGTQSNCNIAFVINNE